MALRPAFGADFRSCNSFPKVFVVRTARAAAKAGSLGGQMAALGAAFRAGDAVLARIYINIYGRIEHLTGEAVVIEPMSVRTGLLLLDVTLPNGSTERRNVAADNVMPGSRRRSTAGVRAQRLGLDDDDAVPAVPVRSQSLLLEPESGNGVDELDERDHGNSSEHDADQGTGEAAPDPQPRGRGSASSVAKQRREEMAFDWFQSRTHDRDLSEVDREHLRELLDDVHRQLGGLAPVTDWLLQSVPIEICRTIIRLL